jgi:hypothetical protein
VGEGIWKQISPEKRRIKQTESLTPKLDFGVGGGVSKQLFLTDVEDDRTAVIGTMCQPLRRMPRGDKTAAVSMMCQVFRRKIGLIKGTD